MSKFFRIRPFNSQIYTYEPAEETERREIFGITLEQKRNTNLLGVHLLENIPTRNQTFPETAQRDALVALVTLKYTQSNAITLTYDGQCIGVGAGQQSRIQCTRLAATKAALWYLRQHPGVFDLPWKPGVRRQERVNAIDQYLKEDMTPIEHQQWLELFEDVPKMLTAQEKQEWLAGLREVVLGSDGYIPFQDTIDCAVRSGVSYIVQPGGSLRDQDVVDACNAYEIVMTFTGVRLFHH